MQCFGEGLVGQDALKLVAAAPEHTRTLPAQLAGNLFHQTRLAHTDLAADEDQFAGPRLRCLPCVIQQRHLPLPANQPDGREHVERAAPSRDDRGYFYRESRQGSDLNVSTQDGLVEGDCLAHRLRVQLGPHDLAAAVVLLQCRVALAEATVGAHRLLVGVLAQRITAQQALGRGQGGLVVSCRLVGSHQPGQCLEKEDFQPVTLAQDPVVVKALEKIAAVQGNRGLKAGHVRPRDLGLKRFHVEPEIGLLVELHRAGVAHEDRLVGQAAPDVPQGGGQGAARVPIWPLGPEEADQPVSGLGLVAVEGQVGEQ